MRLPRFAARPGRPACIVLLLGWTLVPVAFSRAKPALITIFAQRADVVLPEHPTFTLIDAGPVPGTARDGKLSRIPWSEVTAVLTTALAQRGYVPAAGDATLAPDLTIMVDWGRTKPYDDLSSDQLATHLGELRRDQAAQHQQIVSAGAAYPSAVAEAASMQNAISDAGSRLHSEAQQRVFSVWGNANLLGYDRELTSLNGQPGTGRPGARQQELLQELNNERFYAILRAYVPDPRDGPPGFSLVWVTRLSIRTHRDGFVARLRAMMPFASPYFGHSSGELIRAFNLQALESGG